MHKQKYEKKSVSKGKVGQHTRKSKTKRPGTALKSTRIKLDTLETGYQARSPSTGTRCIMRLAASDCSYRTKNNRRSPEKKIKSWSVHAVGSAAPTLYKIHRCCFKQTTSCKVEAGRGHKLHPVSCAVPMRWRLQIRQVVSRTAGRGQA